MGLFSSIKKNLSHGGVKINLQAPASVNMSDASLPVTITLTASDQLAQVKSVKVEIQAQDQNTSFSQPSGQSTPNNTPNPPQIVAQAVNTQPFTLNPAQVQTFQLSILMNAGAAAQAQIPDGMPSQLAHAIASLQSLTETLNKNSYTYSLVASADVDGVSLDPCARQDLQILKPGQFGTAINKQINF